jgi:hypothetical protein
VPSQGRLRLNTERLLLRPPVVEDAATELLIDPEVMTHSLN